MSPDEKNPDARFPSGSPEDTARRETQLHKELQAANATLRELATELTPAQRERLAPIERALDQSGHALRESEENLAAVFRRNPFPMWLFDPKTLAFLEVNEAAIRHYGYSREEFLSMTLRDIRPPEDIERLEKSIAPPGVDVYPADLGPPVRHLKKDGTLIHVEITAKSVNYEGREARLVLSLDITERVEAEQRLHLAEERFRLAANSTNDALWDWDVQTDHLWWSEGFTHLFGYKPGEFEQTIQWWADQIHPEDRRRVYGSLRAAAEGTAETWKEEYRFYKADGSIAWVLDRGQILRDEHGKAVRVIGGFAEVTDSHTMMEALRHSEKRFRSIFESDVVGLFFASLDGKIHDANGAFLEMLGYTREEFQRHGLDWQKLSPPQYKEADRKSNEGLIATGRTEPYEKVFYRKDGGKLPVLVGASLIDREQRIGIGFVIDISERVRAREALVRLNEELEKRVRERTGQLEKARDEAQRANISKNEFLSRMSHELRTPMNAILGFAQILEIQDLSRDQQHCVRQILAGGRHLLNLINEVLDIARIESGRMTVSPEPIVLRDVLHQSLEMVRPAIDGHHIELDWDTSGCENTWVVADPSRLKQVFINLLSNAIKYNRRGGRVRLYCEHLEEDTLRIHFNDTGMGIPMDKISRLFTPFDRLGQEASGIEGSGLGLALTKRLLDVMKGRIHISSVPGEGTNVIVDLRRIETPLEEQQDQERESAGERTIPPLASSNQHLVLYIEDNLSNVALVERLLSFSPNIELASTTTGGAGLKISLDQKPDLILLDLNLPDMDGYGVLNRIRSHPTTAKTPVVIISADASAGQVERLLAAGADAYLTKPLDVREFLAKVYGLLQAPGAKAHDTGRREKGENPGH